VRLAARSGEEERDEAAGYTIGVVIESRELDRGDVGLRIVGPVSVTDHAVILARGAGHRHRQLVHRHDAAPPRPSLVRSFTRHRLEHSAAALDVELIDQLEALDATPTRPVPPCNAPKSPEFVNASTDGSEPATSNCPACR
jgi:hypothetical protein